MRNGELVREASVRPGREETAPTEGPSIAARTYRSREPLLVEDTTGDERVEGAADYRSLLSVPLEGHGVLHLWDRGPGAFDEQSLALADVFGGYVTQMLDRTTRESPPESADREATERRLQEEREKYRTLIEQFPDGLVTLFDEDHRYQIVGGSVFEHLEVSSEDVEGRRLEDVFPPENVEVLAPLYDGVFDGESGTADVTFEGRVFRVRVVPVRDDEGTVVAGMTISQDITVRKARKEQLEASRKRYQTLLEAVPDPVFVADADTGEILEVNDAAERFRGQPREEIVGLSQADLHPDGEVDAYRQLFEDHIAEGGRRRRLEDGSQIYATTADGQRIPVEISAEAVDLGDERVICGIFHDVSEQLEYERALTTLNRATRDLFEAGDPSEIGQVAADTVAAVLDRAGAAMFRVCEEEAVLRPVAESSPPDIEGVSDLPAFEPGESVAWRVFTDGETAVFEDVRTDPLVEDPETPIRSEILVPMGDHGILVAGRTECDPFDGRAVDLVEILGETVEAALDQAERERDLRERERKLEDRTRDLEELEAINARIRNVTRALVDADTRQEAEQAVCAELVEVDSVAFAWIGDVDPVSESVLPRAWAGDHEAYLDEIPRSLAEENAEPALRATRTRERISVPDTSIDLSEEPWRDRAIRRGFRSVLSIPLLYQESFRGVLTLYATEREGFSETLQSVLSELGGLIANAEVAIDRAHALLANCATELEFEIGDVSCFFLRFARETDCALELDEVVPQSDGSWLVFVRVNGESTDDLIEAAQRAPEVDSARIVGDDGDAFVQIRFTKPFIASKLADRGISVRNIAADGQECQMTVAVPPTVSIHRTADVVSTLYPDSELIAKREQMQPPERERLGQQILETLTPRQREVVETAYRRGYFEDPRNTSGADLAEELGFSPSAFHRHIRAVERKTFETIFGDDPLSGGRAADPQPD